MTLQYLFVDMLVYNKQFIRSFVMFFQIMTTLADFMILRLMSYH